MVDTRELFSGLYKGGRQPPWKAHLDQLLGPDMTVRNSRYADDDIAPHVAPAAASSSSAPAAPPPGLKRKKPAASSLEDDIGPFYYDERSDLEDEMWVTGKYLRHQPRPPGTSVEKEKEERQENAQGKEQEDQQSEQTKEEKRPDDWTSDRNDPLTRPRHSDAVLSCPCCFTPLCYDCQRHDVYVSQYRAMFVTDECTARTAEYRMYEGDRYHPVFCAICETEVGVLDPADELYHFFNVIPGN